MEGLRGLVRVARSGPPVVWRWQRAGHLGEPVPAKHAVLEG